MTYICSKRRKTKCLLSATLQMFWKLRIGFRDSKFQTQSHAINLRWWKSTTITTGKLSQNKAKQTKKKTIIFFRKMTKVNTSVMLEFSFRNFMWFSQILAAKKKLPFELKITIWSTCMAYSATLVEGMLKDYLLLTFFIINTVRDQRMELGSRSSQWTPFLR